MRAKIAYILLPLVAASFTGSACAMNSSSKQMVECRVIGGDKLPAESGGADAFCAAFARAAAAQVPDRRFKVEVQVRGPSMLTAILTTADGKTLPEQTFSISDRGMTKGSLERFANSLVGQVARAASR